MGTNLIELTGFFSPNAKFYVNFANVTTVRDYNDHTIIYFIDGSHCECKENIEKIYEKAMLGTSEFFRALSNITEMLNNR